MFEHTWAELLKELWIRLSRPRGRPMMPGLPEALTAAGVPVGLADRTGRASIEGVPLKVAIRAKHAAAASLYVTVDAPPLQTDLRLGPERLMTLMAQAAGLTDVVVGEPRFDADVRVHARDPARVLKVLDAPTRRAVARAVQAGAVFDEGRWALDLELGGRASRVSSEALRKQLEAVARAHAAVAEGLERPMRAALAERVRSDPAGGVRRHAVELLVRRNLASPQVLSQAVDDADPEIRLIAATAFGVRGQATLVALLGDAPRRVRVGAAAALAKHPMSDKIATTVVGVVAEALTDAEHAATAAEVLVSVGTPAAAQALAADGSAVARRALERLKSAADPTAVGTLAIAEDRGGELAIAEEPPAE